MGRPKLRASARRYRTVAVRLTDAEYRRLRRQVAGRSSLSSWARQVLLVALERAGGR